MGPRKKRLRIPAALPLLLVLTALAVCALGTYLKTVLAPTSEVYASASVMEVPFLLLNRQDDLERLLEPLTAHLAPMRTVPETEPLTEPVTEPVTEPATEPPTQPETEPPTEPETEPPTEPPTEPEPAAVFGEDESFFDDALFIGDSRMVSVATYGRLGEADYFAEVGMSVFSAFSTTASDLDFGPETLEDLLDERVYGKVFLMLGLNECGYAPEKLQNQYAYVIDQIRLAQPDARIYILLVYGVSRAKANYASYFGPENLTKMNEMLQELADGETVFCLDPRPLFEDEEGYILEEYSGDGVHLYGKYADLLSRWLCEQIY